MSSVFNKNLKFRSHGGTQLNTRFNRHKGGGCWSDIFKTEGPMKYGWCIIIGIVILSIICVIVAMKTKDKRPHGPKFINMSQSQKYPTKKSSSSKSSSSSSSRGRRIAGVSRRSERFDEEEEREPFVRNLTEIYATANRYNPLVTDEEKIKSEYDGDYKIHPDQSYYNQEAQIGMKHEEKKEGFDNPQYAEEEDAEEQEIVQYEVPKASETGRNSGAERKATGEQRRGKLNRGSLLAPIPDKEDDIEIGDRPEFTNPVKGISTGNPRLNNKMMTAFMIDDRGEGVNLGVSKPIETFGPAISTNSRLAGSSMNIEPITGACFKKYDTDTFFENNTPSPPKLNILEGEPLPLKYNVNNTV